MWNKKQSRLDKYQDQDLHTLPAFTVHISRLLFFPRDTYSGIYNLIIWSEFSKFSPRIFTDQLEDSYLRSLYLAIYGFSIFY